MASFWCLKNRNIEEDAKELLWGYQFLKNFGKTTWEKWY